MITAMKTILKISIILVALAALGWSSDRQSKSSQTGRQYLATDKSGGLDQSGSLYVEGAITVKLKPGAGEFGKQTGAVHFGIQSLDDKVDAYEVYQLEKNFRYNPAKLRAGLPDLSRIYKLSFPQSLSAEEIARDFSSDPNVEYAEPIPIIHLLEVPDDSLYSQLQHLPQIFAPQAWNIHKGENGSEEIIIAINDSGVDWHHVDLVDNIWQNLAEDADGDGHTMEYNGTQWVLDPDDLNGIDDDANGFTDDLIGWNFITNSNDPYPIPGYWEQHGTHCAGIADGRTNNGAGIASISWNLSLMPICVFPGTYVTEYDGIIYAAENGADIISNSWGDLYYYAAGQEAVNYAAGLGSIVVAGAGNENNSNYFYPACFQNVISVASVSGDDVRAFYSSYYFPVDISAPGGGTEGGILSTVPGNAYLFNAGTSMATPCVSGSLGLLKSYHPDWTNDQLITQLLGTADDIDSLNPDYINMLGTGRVNAYRMLTEPNVQPFLKLELVSFSSEDDNGNKINEPGELVTLSFDLYNHMQCYGSDNVNVTLLSDDPDIVLINNTFTVNIPPDSSFSIYNHFQIQIGPGATSHFAKLTLHFDAGIRIALGEDINFEVLVAPSGIFVYEGKKDGRDYSGTFIASFLDRLGFSYTYHNTYPAALLGFETVFLSHGNFGYLNSKGTLFTEEQSLMLQEFLESGGNVYVEMGGMFKRIVAFENSNDMRLLFGVDYILNPVGNNRIDTLLGTENSPTGDMVFTGSHQVYNYNIDRLFPDIGAIIPFSENDYGNVSIMNDGTATYGHKTFYLSYTLAELCDRDATSSRYNILLKVMEFFGYALPQGYLLSNFIAENTIGKPPLEVHFTDISISDPAYPVNSWQWDFDNDGFIDSYDQNPSWLYNNSGSYEIKLITSNGLHSDTLVREDLIHFNFGNLVYEGIHEGADYSGVFIRDYLQGHGYTVTYQNILPEHLEGFSAIFLSYGNCSSGWTPVGEKMAVSLIDYLEYGGYVYLEGGDALGFDQGGNHLLHNLFGLLNAIDCITLENPIDNLAGQPDAITHDMVFTGNSQVSNFYVDAYNPLSDGITAFIESGYGDVAVQNSGPSGCRTFCFSYALSKLTDGEFPNTREELLQRILDFFDLTTNIPEVNQGGAIDCSVYPNPVKSSVTFRYSLNEECRLTVIIDNSNGQQVSQPVNERQAAGEHTLQWDTGELPSGVYFYRVQAGKEAFSGKMILIK
jgi:serine protease